MTISNPQRLNHWHEYSPIDDASQFDELNKLRIAFNRKLVEITVTATEYTKPISISDMICIGGDQLKEMFISKWDSSFQVGFLTRLEYEVIENAYIDEDDQEEILTYLRIKELEQYEYSLLTHQTTMIADCLVEL